MIDLHIDPADWLRWSFVIEGPPATPYEGGEYLGRIRFPASYPFAPPSFIMCTRKALWSSSNAADHSVMGMVLGLALGACAGGVVEERGFGVFRM